MRELLVKAHGMLVAIQYSYEDKYDLSEVTSAVDNLCPVCRVRDYDNHRKDCILGNLITEIEKKLKEDTNAV